MSSALGLGRRAARVVAGAAIAAALGGCFLFRKLPRLELYRLVEARAPDGGGPSPAAGPLLVTASVAIRPYETPGVYRARQIVYRVGETGYGSYPYKEWAIPLGEMLGMLTETVLGDAPIAGGPAIYDPPSARRFTYAWRGTVREFEEVVHDRAVSAAVRLDVQLVRIADDSVVWSGSRRAERPVADPSMPAIVRTLSELSSEVVHGLAADAKKALPAIAVRDSTARP